jgi:carboxypeptidase Taq
VEAQRALCGSVMRLLDFDFEAGRLDVSTHPFCGGVPEDVRMTTRFSSEDFLGSLMGTVHETGHGRYEQNRPRETIDQPVSQARSMALHESQSLSFEMQLGSPPGSGAPGAASRFRGGQPGQAAHARQTGLHPGGSR